MAHLFPLFALLLLAPLGWAQPATTAEARLDAVRADLGGGPVYTVPVEGMIDAALANYVDRALADAEAQ
ncbi:MAG: hypothetical protein R3362_07525, partial [Rhodothermales bacterium]|nr:hypothetical protein [Rhodothermales bacterium]